MSATPVNRSATHPSLHIRDAQDAHVVLEAVRLNMLPLIKRRLISSEREMLASGNVFVWEEAEDEGGLLRWTDGRRWSQSRMRGDYLFYEEKVETTQEEKDAKAARRARRASDPTAVLPPPTRRKDRPSKPNGLTKQTYSAIVHLPGSTETRKWHVVAYFSGNDYLHLPLIENYDYLRRIRVPEGIFLNSKSLSSRMDQYSCNSDEVDGRDIDRSTTYNNSVYSTPTMASTTLPYPPPLSPPLPGDRSQRVSLPPLSSLDYPDRPNIPRRRTGPLLSHPSTDVYTPLSMEDRRALERLRISL
ncbi:hypothetical protein Moror_9855 [Moniliophthora roreri MCA 2997]|uniref:cAMP-independent regulatory protein pac2 n=1 Tax=Moniliophthora roreri (strain MCA 2997) TaxID=1381753 RepID=V2Y4E5_MONRO|nr:hypothetical protein Moror_9855 [Moniliophthora roreri MCA 2997]KAI3607011.1 hypothetical protein WG66_007853 [Moniliophthora roreri]